MPSKRPTRPASRPAVSLPQVADPAIAKALKDLAERIRELEAQLAAVSCDGRRGFAIGRDAEGDTYYRPRDGGVARLAIGVTGQALITGADGVPVWGAAAGAAVADGDKGDITVSGAGATWTIDPRAVTFGKIAALATDRLVGRDTAGTGDLESLILDGGIEFTGAGGVRRSALTGDVTASAGSNATTIAADAVTNAKLADMADQTIKGNDSGGAANPQDLTVPEVWAMLGNAHSSVLMNPGHALSAITGTRTMSTGECYAVYVGRAPKAITSLTVCYRVTTIIGGVVTFAELAIGTGAVVAGGNATITPKAYTDCAAIWNSTGTKATTVTVTLAAGDDIWILFAKSSTVSNVMRACTNGSDDIQVGLQQITGSGVSVFRPSSNIGTPTAFTIEASGTNPIWCAAVI